MQVRSGPSIIVIIIGFLAQRRSPRVVREECKIPKETCLVVIAKAGGTNPENPGPRFPSIGHLILDPTSHKPPAKPR